MRVLKDRQQCPIRRERTKQRNATISPQRAAVMETMFSGQIRLKGCLKIAVRPRIHHPPGVHLRGGAGRDGKRTMHSIVLSLRVPTRFPGMGLQGLW